MMSVLTEATLDSLSLDPQSVLLFRGLGPKPRHFQLGLLDRDFSALSRIWFELGTF